MSSYVNKHVFPLAAEDITDEVLESEPPLGAYTEKQRHTYSNRHTKHWGGIDSHGLRIQTSKTILEVWGILIIEKSRKRLQSSASGEKMRQD